jgi:hypothetical protein
MPPLPNYRREYRRQREEVVASAVAAVLRTEGRVVEDGCRPAVGQTRSPDWMLTIDGVPAALEVTALLPRPHVQKAERLIVDQIEAGVRGMLMPRIDGLGGQVVLGLAYSASGVAGRGRTLLATDTETLAVEVRATLDRLPAGGESVDLESSVPWVIRAELILIPGPHDGFYVSQAPDDAQQPDLDDWVGRVIESKGDQHVRHADRGILAIDSMFDDAEDLREAFGLAGTSVPWWRVYSVVGSTATLILETIDTDSRSTHF